MPASHLSRSCRKVGGGIHRAVPDEVRVQSPVVTPDIAAGSSECERTQAAMTLPHFVPSQALRLRRATSRTTAHS